MTIENAHVIWRDDGLPYSTDYNDIYFSGDNAEGESRHVFLDANKLTQRWSELADTDGFTLVELGFGSGLNFLVTAYQWLSLHKNTCRLHYIALEKHPLKLSDIRRLHALWPQFAELSSALLALYPDHTAGCHRLQLTTNICLDLHFGDAEQTLLQDRTFAQAAIDCWYLDGFSPAVNPALWSPTLLSRIGELSHDKTTLSSYSVAGAVRQGLIAAGFQPAKLPGYGRKRHMLFATRIASKPRQPVTVTTAPWLQLPPGKLDRGHAIIIGAGLAGCSTAYALATRGWHVTVVDSASQPCDGASAISPLALRCRVFKQPSAIADLYTHGFLFANRQFNRMQTSADIGWHATGVMQLSSSLNNRHREAETDILAGYADAVFSPLSQQQASAMTGVPVTDSAWHLPLGGWLTGKQLCNAYLAHSGIRVQTGFSVQAIHQQVNGTWTVQPATTDHEPINADVVVIANAAGAVNFEQCRYLPLQQIRGQVSHVEADSASKPLSMVVSGKRTLFPAQPADTANHKAWHHTIAATYDRTSDNTPSPAHDEENLTLAQSLLASTTFTSVCGQQVAIRCNSDDRIPVVGPLANSAQVINRLDALSRNAHHQFQPEQVEPSALYYSGLYINVAHGSNGVATCPLSAELLASMICNEALPCTAATTDALNPIRFLIRGLKQQKLA